MTEVAQFEKFFDDAAIFPPGLAPLDQAVNDHLAMRKTERSRLIGPLILPLAKLEEASSLAGAETLDVSVVLTNEEFVGFRDVVAKLENLDVEAVEAKFAGAVPDQDDWLKQLSLLRHENPEVTIFMELPSASISESSLTALRELKVGLKFRTGGIKPELFPSSEELIRVLDTAIRVGLPFKLTAGLHRAMRYTDETTGFDHFGFINIAAAIEELQAGNGTAKALDALNSNDSSALTAELEGSTAWRDSFQSFGTCSISEPLETLEEIGMFSEEKL